jgi:DNA-binding response OmpR family regulator
MAKLLLVEDDEQLASSIEDSLVAQNYTVERVMSGTDGLDRLNFYSYDLAILDWNLPEINGVDVCKQHRESGGSTPILMLTGRTEIDDRVFGLDAGADDYLTKPFSPTELNARIRALLRRPTPVQSTVLKAGDLELDTVRFQLLKDGRPVKLSAREYALMEFFMRNPGQLFNSETLLNRLWSSESDVLPDNVRVYVNKLRSKIDNKGESSLIRNIHGLGYIFKESDEESLSKK